MNPELVDLASQPAQETPSPPLSPPELQLQAVLMFPWELGSECKTVYQAPLCTSTEFLHSQKSCSELEILYVCVRL